MYTRVYVYTTDSHWLSDILGAVTVIQDFLHLDTDQYIPRYENMASWAFPTATNTNGSHSQYCFHTHYIVRHKSLGYNLVLRLLFIHCQ